jgi:hypothetical protein
MDKNLTFKYSIFYILQPIIGTSILCLLLFLIIYLRPQHLLQNYQFIPWTILLCFIIFSISKCLSIVLKRTKDPIRMKIDEKAVSAIYRNGKVIQILWDEIEKIQIRRDRWRFGAETIEITSKQDSKQIVCNDDLEKYKLFKNAIIEKKGKP